MSYGRRASILLEVMLATMVVALCLVGLGIVLQKCLEASTVNYVDTRLRDALESRLAELQADRLQTGEQTFRYFQNEIEVVQKVEVGEFRNRENKRLPGMLKVNLVARYLRSEYTPLMTEAYVYQP